jgi:hypothetical protein
MVRSAVRHWIQLLKKDILTPWSCFSRGERKLMLPTRQERWRQENTLPSFMRHAYNCHSCNLNHSKQSRGLHSWPIKLWSAFAFLLFTFPHVSDVFLYLTYGQFDHTPLMSAALGGHCEIVKMLLNCETNAGAIDSVSIAVSRDMKFVCKISLFITWLLLMLLSLDEWCGSWKLESKLRQPDICVMICPFSYSYVLCNVLD